MHKIISVLKIIAINAFILLILLFLTNAICRSYLQSSIKSRADLPNYLNNQDLAREIFLDYASISHEYAPFIGWKTLPYQGRTLTIQNNGFRNVVEPVLADTADRLSVGFFGGSTLWGEGSPDSSTIPSLFAQKNPQFKVYNFGQLAFNSRQNLAELMNLYSEGVKLDYVIFYDGVNDAAFLCPDEVSVPGHRMEPVFKKRLYASNKYLIGEALYKYLVKDILIVTNQIRERRFGQEKQSEYQCYQDIEKIQSIANGLLNNWQIASQIVQENDGIFIGVLQPMAFRGKPNLSHLEELEPELGRSMNAVYNLWLQHFKNSSTPDLLNLVNSFNNDDYIYIDFCHVSPNGNGIIANEITDFIELNHISEKL